MQDTVYTHEITLVVKGTDAEAAELASKWFETVKGIPGFEKIKMFSSVQRGVLDTGIAEHDAQIKIELT